VRASSFKREEFSVACAPKRQCRPSEVGFRFQWEPALQLYSPVDSLTLYRSNKTMHKYRGDASIENQLKIDKLDQNRLQSIEKIQKVSTVESARTQESAHWSRHTHTRSKIFWIRQPRSISQHTKTKVLCACADVCS
jgi:hypothetical protein